MDRCASPQILEIYNSKLYISILFLNIALTITSFVVSIYAIRKLVADSIINISIRIFLVTGVSCFLIHQIAYLCLRLQLIYLIFFKLNNPCDLIFTSNDCRFIIFGLVAGNCGMSLTQSAISIDRIFATIFPKTYSRMNHHPGSVLSMLVFFGIFLVHEIIFYQDPFTDVVHSCGALPSKSLPRFKIFLTICFYLSIAHIIISVIILIINLWQDRRQRFVENDSNLTVNERFERRAALRSTQAVFLLSMAQFLSMLLYSVMTEHLIEMQPVITPIQYAIGVALIYTTPYTCIVIPLLIIFTVSYTKRQRFRSINSMTSMKESTDDHMKKMQRIWK